MIWIRAVLVVALCLFYGSAAFGQKNLWNQLNSEVVKLYGQAKYADAEKVARRALEVAKKTFGPIHPKVATSLNNLALLYVSQGKYSDAEPLYKKSLALYERSLGKNHTSVGMALNNLAELYRSQGKYAEAEPLYRRSLAIKEKALGKDHPDVALALNNLALLYVAQGKYAEAEPLFKRSLELYEKSLGEEHTSVANSLSNLAALYHTQGKYAKAESLYRRSLAIFEKALGKNHPHVAGVLNNLATLYKSRGKYSEAEPLYKRSLAIKEKALGKDHPDVALALNNLAALYDTQGKYAKAEPLYRRCLAIRERSLGKDHPDVALALNNLAALYDAEGRYSDAERLHKKALKIREKALGKNHPDVAQSLNNLAALYQSQGKSSQAEPLYKRSLALYERSLGKNHALVSVSLNNLAELYRTQGRYSEAEPLYRRSLAIKEKALGKDHPDVAVALNNLALLYVAEGKYSEAEPLYRRSLAIREKSLGKDHPEVASSLNNLAALYDYQGRYAKAESLYRRSLAIKEKALGKDHPDVALSLNNLATLYENQGRYSEAEPLYRRSLAIFEKVLGKDHPSVATSLGNIGRLYREQGNHEQALRMFQRALAICSKAGISTVWPKNLIADLYLDQGDLARAAPLVKEAGYSQTQGRFQLLRSDYAKANASYDRIRKRAEKTRNADDLFTGYTGLGMVYEGLGQLQQAAAYYRKAVDFTEELRSSLSRAARETFFDVRVYGFYRTAPYEGLARVLMRMGKPIDALKGSEYSKARVFAEALSRRPEVAPRDVPKAILRRDESLNDQLSALKQARLKAYKEGNQTRIDALEPQITELEQRFRAYKKLLRKEYPLFAATKYPEPMELSQTALHENEWVLSFDVTDPGIIIYLTRGKHLVKALFKPVPRKELDELVRRFRRPLETEESGITRRKLASFDLAAGKKLADILLRDVLPDMPKEIPLIVVPDDSLGVLPFEMLVLNDEGKVETDRKIPYVSGAQFFGDRNPISYFQSITALTLARTLGRKKQAAEKCLVLDDPVFNTNDDRVKRVAAKKKKVLLASLPDTLMSIKTEIGLTFPRLPLTGELGKCLKQIDPNEIDEYSGMKAAKTLLFEKPLGKYGSMIFATHGYFGKDLPGIREPVLVLTLVGQPEGKDGFLRMSEAMGLKMNADIVALTACQTGLGRRITGEGTMGMGRAFQYAGAKSVVMSLWSVSEASSVRLVESFFKHLKEGKSKLEALQLARKEIRQAGYDHPFYWAPFILVGEVK